MRRFVGRVLIVAVPVVAVVAAVQAGAAVENEGLATYWRQPLRFEPNQGQSDPQVRYLARGLGYGLYFTGQPGATLALGAGRSGKAADVLRLGFPGARASTPLEAEEPQAGRSHYYVGDRSRWRGDVGHFGRVTYRDAYPGVDVTFYGRQAELEYDFVLAPGADPAQIRLRLEGARDVSLDDASGDLVVSTAGGELRHRAPFVYQQRGGRRVKIEARCWLAR
jgi:hypothetical protein